MYILLMCTSHVPHVMVLYYEYTYQFFNSCFVETLVNFSATFLLRYLQIYVQNRICEQKCLICILTITIEAFLLAQEILAPVSSSIGYFN